MKSLNEEIAIIKKSNLSKNGKRNALISLQCLCPSDINALLDVWYAEEKAAARAERAERRANPTLSDLVRNLTFGVEIECYNAPVSSVIEQARQRGLEINHEGYNHRDSATAYKLVSDASIQGESPIECVTPVLSGGRNGFSSLKKCCDALKAVGAMVNRSTGLHVHVGYKNMSDTHYINVFKNYQQLELVIDSFMASSRRGNNAYYSQSLIGHDFNNWCRTKEDVVRELHTRYKKVNAQSWDRHHTIEFRQHQGSTNYEKISKWVMFLLKLVVWSKDNVLESAINSIYDIPFLTDTEKAYFMSRNEYFASHVA